jgi:hypothetical protein
MKKAKSEKNDWLRSEYKREDLGPIVRGKYARRIVAESNVVVIDPTVAKAFPNEESVNTALRALIAVANASARPGVRAAKARSRVARTS